MQSLELSLLLGALPLIGVIVGGLITYLTTRRLEERKWDREKRERFLRDRRDALRLIAEWIDPIDLAVDRAAKSHALYGYGTPARDVQVLLEEITRTKIPASARFLLPSGLYGEAEYVARKIARVVSLGGDVRATAEMQMDPSKNVYGMSHQEIDGQRQDLQLKFYEEFEELQRMANQYGRSIREAFMATYEVEASSFKRP
jgi:hypothetical protein